MLMKKPVLKVVHFLLGNPFCTLGGFIPPSVYKNSRGPFFKETPADYILRQNPSRFYQYNPQFIRFENKFPPTLLLRPPPPPIN